MLRIIPMMKMSTHPYSISEGSPWPMGISIDAHGLNFAVSSQTAASVTLCLFESNEAYPIHQFPLTEKTGDVWHIRLNPVPREPLYALKIQSLLEADPHPHFLTDPYAQALSTSTVWDESLTDMRPYQPLGVVHPPALFDWEGVEPPCIPLQDLIIYEMHVRGFTQDPSSAVNHRGKFLGIIEKIPYLKRLGVNAIKLLPIQEFNEKEVRQINPLTYQKLFQYWGYSTVNYLSPMNRYAVSTEYGSSILEFKTLVRELHRNGIEVILDVVFNHTAEGGRSGPCYSFKGIDKAVYYILNHEGGYKDFTGCGNTLNCQHPRVINFIQDCLHYWVTEMHIDGFRFDLASIFYRNAEGDPVAESPLVERISKDPILAKTKLIAEPWDAAGLYQVGHFYPESARWSEWNGKYRDSLRRFLIGIPGEKREFATRLCGSQDLYGTRSPVCSINFVTAHDGFTLADLVSYNQKHNIENGENNQDGSSHNDSWNCGAEGGTIDKKVQHLREKQKRNFILALMISQGVPMIQMGDEYSHTKKGNNNTWCQDNELNWFLWDGLENNQPFFRFYAKMIQFRKEHPLLRLGRFLTAEDITWHGTAPFEPDWDGDSQVLAFAHKDPVERQDLYAAFNVKDKYISVYLPPPPTGKKWHLVANTSAPPPLDFYDEFDRKPLEEDVFKLQSHSAILLKAY